MKMERTVTRVKAVGAVVWEGLVVAASLLLRISATVLLVALAGLEWLLPKLAQWTRPLRKKLRRRVRNAWRRAKRRPFWTAVTVALTGLVVLNGTIRLTGGNPELLSTRRLSDKAVAVARLAGHLPFHAFGTCGASRDDLVLAAAHDHDVPVSLVRAVARTESGFRPHVISHAGAMGVMQLMPSTAALMGVSDPFDARESLQGGAKYLSQLYRRYDGNIRRTAAAYHAGPGAVPVSGPLRVGPTTRRYMKVVARRVAALR